MKKMPNISQGKVLTRLTCGGICKDLFLRNLPTSLTAVRCENQSASGKATRTEWHLFSERELMFTFAICYRPSVCRLSVSNVRAPYSGGSNFRQYFYVRYFGHPLTFTENFTEIFPGEPLCRGSETQEG